MLKKINVTDLKVGMTVEKMDRPWLKHPFLTNRKKITSQRQIDRLREFNIDEVYIYLEPGEEEERSLGTQPPETGFPWEAQTGAFPSPEMESEEEKPAEEQGTSVPQEVPFEEEIKTARLIQKEAQVIVQDMMEDIRKGNDIEIGRVEQVVGRMIDSIFRNRDALVSLSRIKGYDEYTYVHSLDVCILALTFGLYLNLDQEDLQKLGIGAILHDTGKMRIPTTILNKPGPLTEREYLEIKKHPFYSLEIMEKTGGLPEEAKLIAMQHHERRNGRGYPSGLKDDEIHVFSQLTAIIDVYDAVTTNRCYQRAMSAHRGMQILFELGQTDFNLTLVERFIQCLGIYPVGTVVELDSSEIGIVVSVNSRMLLRPKIMLLYANKLRPYSKPKAVDLAETSPDGENFLRSILRVLSRQQWDIDVDRHLQNLENLI
jgi:HD-GYP domain-containing protein (c-di-GMP phosphodiesterase class II)